MRWRSTIRSIWRVIFAITAILEIQFITVLMRADENCRSTLHYEDDEFSINYTFVDRVWESTFTLSQYVWMGLFFCFLCIVEALVRAVEARKAALDNRALDELEKSLLRAAQRSSTRLSMFFLGAAADQNHKKKAVTTVSKVLRSWIPAIATIAFWLFILPLDVADFHVHCGSDSLHDSSVATQWINRMLSSYSALTSAFHGLLESFFWSNILPFRIHREPQRFVQRLQVILRWIRFIRFAGPLFRMGLKLQDQVRVVWKAKIQSNRSEKEKQRRIERPSLLFTDIQNLLQLAKVQTALARVPSFSLQSSTRLNKISSSVMESYNKKRVLGKRISIQLTKIQNDYMNFGNESFSATSDLYDRITRLSQDITTTINSEKWNYSNRYLKSLRSLLSSRRYLISPRTRFSLTWRMTVTNCLILEIARLCASWHLSKSFSVPLSQVVSRLFVDCKAPEQMKHALDFIINPINRFRRHMFPMFHILGSPPVVAVCTPSGPHAVLFLLVGRMLEFFVDAVVFFDIFVWFATGEIDSETHAIIPKPFFTRCILPGTLVQVLDHPTLPDLLPSLMKSTLATFAAVGYSRCIRWILAVTPAVKMLVLDPLTAYFFNHLEEDEGLMHYADSVGMLTPERRRGSLGALSIGDSQRYLFRKQSDGFNSSVGLSVDASPHSSRYELLSMVSTEGSQTDGTTDQFLDGAIGQMPSSIIQPSYSGIPLENSPKKNHRSVHFDLFNEENRSSEGYSLSSSVFRTT